MDGETHEITDHFQAETSINLGSQLRLIKDSYSWDSIVSTGYGRQLSQKVLGGEAVTEIKAYTISAHHFYKDIETVLDLGGQDTKALLINRLNGQLLKFEMNDKRVLITGCPVGGDVLKVLKLVDEEGAAIVGLDNCTGLKLYTGTIEEGSGDPLLALAKRYLNIPCACMTPNNGRTETLSKLVAQLQPDLVIDLVLQSCHTYNVEAVKVESFVRNELGTNYLKVVTDFSAQDVGQLKTRIGAALEMI